MKIQEDTKITDMGSFLSEIENKLFKEGAALQSLAQTWFEGGDEYKVCHQIGVDISTLSQRTSVFAKTVVQNLPIAICNGRFDLTSFLN